jgi:hypothetical protein
MKTTAHEVNAMIEASYAANAKGTTDFGLKLIDIMRTTLRQPLASRPAPVKAPEPDNDEPCVLPRPCPCCGGRMLIIETFARGATPRHKATPMPPVIRIDTS